ncbi:putative extracellular membrane 8-cysteine cfem [Diaporthe ampelina]|uniref:Putative extracellular membrane 8-cysteine cfem n=1 Tax=Diaporthe ampelina TaxID=1214573 RepID=A0A0G2FNW8_9PEZI|nr:putative extracellular membrane 8-cysteine cfem [Diaporthe ampelina]
MKVTLLAAGLVAAVFAQDLSSIPQCAQSCLTDAISQDGQCQATDTSCVCGRIDALTTLATSCVLSACGQDVALNQVLPAVQAYCAGGGSGSSAASSAASSAPASTSATPTSASEASESSAASSSASASASSSESSASASATESSSGTATSSASHSGTTHASSTTSGSSATATDASATSSVVTAGAAQYGSVGGLAAFVLGALAIF